MTLNLVHWSEEASALALVVTPTDWNSTRTKNATTTPPLGIVHCVTGAGRRNLTDIRKRKCPAHHPARRRAHPRHDHLHCPCTGRARAKRLYLCILGA